MAVENCVVDEGVLERLSQQNVFLSVTGAGMPPLGSNLAYNPKDVVEAHVGLYGGASLTTVGSYSYALSALPPGMKVGRYCSLGTGLRVQRGEPTAGVVSTTNLLYERHGPLVRSIVEHNAQLPPKLIPGAVWKALPVLGHDVWVGQDVYLCRGIEIGTGAIVRDGAHVVQDVPAYAVVEGNPAVVVGHRFPLPVAARLTQSAWWNLNVHDLLGQKLTDAEQFLNELDPRKRSQLDASPMTVGELLKPLHQS